MTDPRNFLRWAALIIVVSLGWNYALPGLVGYFNGTFYESGIEAKLPAHATSAIAKYRTYESERQQYQQMIRQADRQIEELLEKGQGSEELDRFLKVRQAYKSELASLKSPIHLLPYYGNLTNYYFSSSCAFLGLLALWGIRRSDFRVELSKVAITGFILYVGWASIGWLRNFVFYGEGRTIFAFANYDISRSGFVLQELRALVMFVLVAMVWELCFRRSDEAVREILPWDSVGDSLRVLDDGATAISRRFAEWQITSLLLLSSFLPWTFFYYSNAIRSDDSRYILSALVMHIYWLVSWILATLPLVLSFRKWSNLRSRALAMRAGQSQDSKEIDRSIAFLKELNPLSSAQILWASVASVVSFFLPLIDLLKKT
jgi:hypothetical protein